MVSLLFCIIWQELAIGPIFAEAAWTSLLLVFFSPKINHADQTICHGEIWTIGGTP